MIYSLHPEAAEELEDAFTFYREQGGNGLAHAFLAEFERVAQLLLSNPDFGTPSTGDRRSYPLRRFPYSLIYRATTENVHILEVGGSSTPPPWLLAESGVEAVRERRLCGCG